MPPSTRHTLLTALAYGLGAFGIGFIFGALRQLVLIPQFGREAGYWIEFPLVTGCILAFGWWLARRHSLPVPAAALIGIGGVAILLLVESAFALGVMNMSAEDYLAQFDLSRGALFPYALALMAITPWVSALLRRH